MNKSTFHLQLVHTDIWGPTSIVSHIGHCYYVHFLDDYNKFSWYLVMKSQAYILQIFHDFKLLVMTSLNEKIRQGLLLELDLWRSSAVVFAILVLNRDAKLT